MNVLGWFWPCFAGRRHLSGAGGGAGGGFTKSDPRTVGDLVGIVAMGARENLGITLKVEVGLGAAATGGKFCLAVGRGVEVAVASFAEGLYVWGFHGKGESSKLDGPDSDELGYGAFWA